MPELLTIKGLADIAGSKGVFPFIFDPIDGETVLGTIEQILYESQQAIVPNFADKIALSAFLTTALFGYSISSLESTETYTFSDVDELMFSLGIFVVIIHDQRISKDDPIPPKIVVANNAIFQDDDDSIE